MATPTIGATRPVVTLVHTSGCHFCDDAATALSALAAEFPLTVDAIDVTDARGAALAHRHRPALFPLVLVDDVFFSAGRLPRRKLRQLLDLRVGTKVT